MKNFEIKAQTDRSAEIRQILLDNGAVSRGIDHQTDTYYDVPSGRLKLREGNIENSLIFYRRADHRGPKRSDVCMAHLGDSKAVKKVLSEALDALCTVRKRRDILFIGQTKFHIDEVEGLGSYVEIEVIDRLDSIGEERLRSECQRFVKLLGILPADLIAHSYSDMILGHVPLTDTNTQR